MSVVLAEPSASAVVSAVGAARPLEIATEKWGALIQEAGLKGSGNTGRQIGALIAS